MIIGLFGKAVTIELDAGNLEIRDEKVIVNDDHSFYISGWNDEDSYGRWIAGTGLFDLRQGMYEVSVDYESLLYNTEVGGNCEDKTGTLQIFRTKKTEDSRVAEVRRKRVIFILCSKTARFIRFPSPGPHGWFS